MSEFEELVLTIARHLELDCQYVERVEVWNRGTLLMNDFWSKLLPGDAREP